MAEKKNISFIGLQKYSSKNRIRLITMLTSGNIETNSNTLFYLDVDSHLQFFVFSFFEVFCKFKEIHLFQWVIIKIESFELNIKSQSSNNEKTHIILIQFVKLKCSHNSFFPALRKTPNLMSTKTFTRAFKTWKNAFEGYFWAFELSFLFIWTFTTYSSVCHLFVECWNSII